MRQSIPETSKLMKWQISWFGIGVSDAHEDAGATKALKNSTRDMIFMDFPDMKMPKIQIIYFAWRNHIKKWTGSSWRKSRTLLEKHLFWRICFQWTAGKLHRNVPKVHPKIPPKKLDQLDLQKFSVKANFYGLEGETGQLPVPRITEYAWATRCVGAKGWWHRGNLAVFLFFNEDLHMWDRHVVVYF